MTDVRVGKAIVRIHGEVDREKVKEATAIYLKKVVAKKKEIHRRKENECIG
jgi:hypothetical protein